MNYFARLAVVAVVGCGGGGDAKPAPGSAEDLPKKPVVTPIEKAKTVELPDKGFKLDDVLGKTPAQLEKVLGHSEKYDPGRIYDSFGKVAVLVEFENDKAALVSVQAPGFSPTEENKDALFKWAGARNDAEWRLVNSDATLEFWDPGARTRFEAREDAGRLFGKLAKQSGLGDGLSRGELRTVLMLSPPFGTVCTRSKLEFARDFAAREVDLDLAALGFRKMQCNIDGVSIPIK